MNSTRRGPTTKALGDYAESLVEDYLREQGIEILGRNIRMGRLEIDIVGRQDRVVLVIEVRSRGAGSYVSGFSSLNRKKRQRIRFAGERLWNRRFKADTSVDRMRFDAVSVDVSGPFPRIEYAPAAF